MSIDEIKKEIREEIDAIVFRASADISTIVEDAENPNYLQEIEDESELDEYFDNVVFNISNAIDDLEDVRKKYEELWNKHCC